MAAFGTGSRRSRTRKNVPLMSISCIIVFVILYAVFVMNSYTKLRQKQQENKRIPSLKGNEGALQPVIVNNDKPPSKTRKKPTCSFREYPKRRYYGLQESSQPDFLENAEYIHGKLPSLLAVDTSSRLTKFCVNQTEWHTVDTNNRLPFADGTNPSILALSRIPSHGNAPPSMKDDNATYLATICMTNSLCSWKDSQQDKQDYRISERDKPDTVRTVLLWLNRDLQTLDEKTIYLQRDAPWGRRNPPKQEKDGTFVLEIKPLDDARLFVYKEKVWISYRDGPNFGYDKQVLNPLYFENDDRVIIKASESVPFCCGRNMALMEHQKVSVSVW